MSGRLPVRKYIKVYVQKRKNKPLEGRERTTSYTLYWKEHGERRFLSLGQYSTRAFAERMAREKEAELNSAKVEAVLKPATWDAVIKDYLDQTYPGHDLPTAERKKQEPEWRKSLGTMKRERLAFGHFERIAKPYWCHDISGRDRDVFVSERLKEVQSPATLEAELRALHTLAELMEEWGHRPKG